MSVKDRVKWMLFPGVNLHARLRYVRLPLFFDVSDPAKKKPGHRILDAGCGNGMLSWQACQRGATVLGVSIKDREVEGNRRLFNDMLKVPEERIRFANYNLYEIDKIGEQFDEIICTEVLEHIRDDAGVVEQFHKVLKPGGCIHICAPNGDHPYNAHHPIDENEAGGHVRVGYTEKTYRELVEPFGFEVEEVRGLGGPIRQAFNWRIKVVQQRFGVPAGMPLFLASLPFLPFEREDDVKVPFSLYVRARKPMSAQA